MENVIFGTKRNDYKEDQYISVGIHDDEEHVYIDFYDKGHACVYHFLIKDAKEYDKFVNELKELFESCESVTAAEDRFDASDDFIYTYLDDYPEYQPEMRTEKEICEYMDEACDRVWLVRKQNLYCNLLAGAETIQLDVLDKVIKAIDEVCDKYNIDFKEPVSDWDYGYWSGILAALRWVMGDEKDCLDT